MAERYNPVYQTLVGDVNREERNIIGIVAYSLYKADKIGFILDHKSKNNGTMPSDEEIQSYCEHLCTGHHLERYKKDARETIEKWLSKQFSNSVKEVENACNARNAEQLDAALKRERSHIKQIIDNSIKKFDKGFPYGLLQSVAGGAIYTIIVAIIIVCWSITNRHVVTISPEGIKVETYNSTEHESRNSSNSNSDLERPFSDAEVKKN